MLWILVGALSAAGGRWHSTGAERVAATDIPPSAAAAREALASNESWTPAHPAAGFSRERLLTEDGHPLGLGLYGVLGLLELSSASLQPQPAPGWEDAWLASDDGTEIYFQQTGNLRTRTDEGIVYVLVEARSWGLLNGVPYSNEPFEEIWCLERNLITYQDGRAASVLRRKACRDTFPEYTPEQWKARKTLIKPDWDALEQQLQRSFREYLFVFEYDEQGALKQVDHFSNLEWKTSRKQTYEVQ